MRWLAVVGLGCALLCAACENETPGGTGPGSGGAGVGDVTAGAIDVVAGQDLGGVAVDTAAGVASETAAEVASVPQCVAATDCPGAPCQVAVCTPTGKCGLNPVAENAPCSDGNACTVKDACLAGSCQPGATLDCNDDNACTADKCNALAGCVNLAMAATAPCDDGNACTNGDHCEAGQCTPGVQTCQCTQTSDCAKFEDGDQCNGTLYCDKAAPPYTCKLNPSTVVTCAKDADGPCAKNACNPLTGQCKLQQSPANSPCSDGDNCTTGDFCDSGQCSAGTYSCGCKQDADCAGQEDGNLCNGTLFCNKAEAKCQVNPLTVASCKTAEDTYCSQNMCNPKDGKCHQVPIHEGKPCDDGTACTPNEACTAGVCKSTTSACECQNDSDCGKKEDGDPCNGTLYCDVKLNKCVVNPATVIHCNTDDDPACLRDTCDSKTGKCSEIALPKDGTGCDDGNPCTPNSQCSAGACVAVTNTCQCQSNADCAKHEDGNVCNGSLYCDLKANVCVVNPATVVVCPNAFDEACLTNQCNPKTGACGMLPTWQGNQCDDGKFCTGGGWCHLGKCDVTVLAACECVQDADCGQIDDGDLCNGTLYCDKTGAKPACKVNPKTVVVCKTVDDTACSKAICQPKTGQCAKVAAPGPCDDGKSCTANDLCAAGQCLGGPKACGDDVLCNIDQCQEPFGCVHLPGPASACDDNNVCTAETCDATKGCLYGPLGGKCDDGNPCTTGDGCAKGMCGGSFGGCDDDNPCTGDGCTAGSCSHNNLDGVPCSDGSPCTIGEVCGGGKCTGAKPKVCDDGLACTLDSCVALSGECTTTDIAAAQCNDSNPCTTESCAAGQGCMHTNNAASCNDNNPCTSLDACVGGKCAKATQTNCDDGNLCTVEACDAQKGGCVYGPAAVLCNDGVACTSADACKNGVCAGKPDCDDKQACTTDVCDLKTGACSFLALAPTACDDGNVCTAGEACAAGKCTGGTQTACDDGNACTDDPCDAKNGCGHTTNSAPCATGGCTENDKCVSGACKVGSVPKLGNVSAPVVATGYTGGQIYGLIPSGNDWFVFGQAITAGVGTNMAHGGLLPLTGLVARMTPSGAYAWKVTGGSVGGATLNGIRAGALDGDGNLVVFSAFSGAPNYGVWARYDGAGKLLNGGPVPWGGKVRDTWGALRRAAFGDIVVYGGSVSNSGGGGSAFAARLDIKTLELQDVGQHNDNAKWSRWMGGTLAAGGKTTVLVGYTLQNGYMQGLVSFYGGDLTAPPSNVAVHGTQTAPRAFTAIAALPAGGYIVAGAVHAAPNASIAAWRLDPAGNVVWQSAPLGDKSVNVGTGVAILGDGTAAISGQMASGSTDTAGGIWRLDHLGKLMWYAELGAGLGDDTAYGVTKLPTGELAAYGRMKDALNSVAQPTVLRMTEFGHGDCASAGLCVGVTMAACPAGYQSSCNLATCDKATGKCSLKFSAGGSCDDGNACTTTETCDVASQSCKGSALTCNDANPCTTDSCDKTLGCVATDVEPATDCGGGKKCFAGKCM